MAHKAGEGEMLPACPPQSEYPYGLRMTLNEEQLSALGLEGLPPAGTTLHLEAVAVVTRSSTEDPDADGDIDYVCVELQLTQLGVEEEGDSEEEGAVERRERRGKRMYGGKDGG